MNLSWHPKEDTAKMIKAAIGGMLVALSIELTAPSFQWNRILIGTLIGAAVRAIMALPESPTVPAHEVKLLNATATPESAGKVSEAQATKP